MIRNAFRFIAATVSILIVTLALFILVPRHYNVPHQTPRQGTKYWDLSTGSHIAYTLIPAKGEKKPYPIIYLHGGPGGPISDRNIATFTPLADEGYDVYLYDQIGCGLSARLDDINGYTADRHKRDLEEIVNKIGAPKVILIAQSWGAILGALFVADDAAKVDRVVFTGPGPIIPINRGLKNVSAPDSLHFINPLVSNADGSRKANNIRTTVATSLAEKFGIKLMSDEEGDNFATYLNNEQNKSTVCDTSKAIKAAPGAGYYVQVMTVASFGQTTDPRPKLQGCTVPILLMKGQCDNQPWGYANEYLHLFPNHQLAVIPNAGHAINIEQPELYLKTIKDFLKQ